MKVSWFVVVTLGLLHSDGSACAQGTEATRMNFVGTATGNGTLPGGTPWSFVGSATQSFTKKSGGGSTGGGFAARAVSSWFAQASASFYYSIDADGVRFGTDLRVSGDFPFGVVQTGSVQSTVAADFDFTTDEPLFYAGTNDSTGMFFSFSSATAYTRPKVLMPGTHSVVLHARGLGAGTPSLRQFDRTSPLNRFIRLTPLPIGYALAPSRAIGDFKNATVLLSRDSHAALLAAEITQWWQSPKEYLRFEWREDASATMLASSSETPVAYSAAGPVVISVTSAGEIRRQTPGGGSIIPWPSTVQSSTFVAASAACDTVLANIFEEGSTNSTGFWQPSTGFSRGPLLPGLVAGAAYTEPVALSGNGQVFAARWSGQPTGFGPAASGTYIARHDGTFFASLGDTECAALNHDGSIGVGYRSTGAGDTPRIWLGGAITDLPVPPGFTSAGASALSDDAELIIGWGRDASDNNWTLVWTGMDRVERLRDYLNRVHVDFSAATDIPQDSFYYSSALRVTGISADGDTLALSVRSTSDDPFSSDERAYVVRLPLLCAEDQNLDRYVDDADFVLFAQAYNALECPSPWLDPCWADIDRSGLVDDADFVLFASAYDRLICDEEET